MKIAFICPWYGKDIPGGAEAECRRTVENLHQRGVAVEVWTTGVKDFEGDWSVNYYRAGRLSGGGCARQTVHGQSPGW